MEESGISAVDPLSPQLLAMTQLKAIPGWSLKSVWRVTMGMRGPSWGEPENAHKHRETTYVSIGSCFSRS